MLELKWPEMANPQHLPCCLGNVVLEAPSSGEKIMREEASAQ